ncbi:MAG: hypothetical protein WDO24_20350 [Pseudomonadota bacterium]
MKIDDQRCRRCWSTSWGQPRRQREQRHDAELLAFRPVGPAVIGQRDAVRQPIERQQVIDPRARGLDPAQPRRPRGELLPGRPRCDQEIGRRQRAFQPVAIPADRDPHRFGQQPMAVPRAPDVMIMRMGQRRNRAAVVDMEMFHGPETA